MQPCNDLIKGYIQNGDIKKVDQWIKVHNPNTNIAMWDDEPFSALVYTIGLAHLTYPTYEGHVKPLDKKTADRIIKMLVRSGADIKHVKRECKSFQVEVNALERSFFIDDETVRQMTKDVRKVLKNK